MDYIPGKKEDRRLLYANYEKWCKQIGHGAATIYAMTRWFKARGFEQETKNRMRPILGVGLKVPEGELDLNEK